MFLILETLIGVMLMATFASRLIAPGGKIDSFATKWIRRPLSALLGERVTRAMDDWLFSMVGALVGTWMAIPLPPSMDRWPAVLLAVAFALALVRAGKTPPPKVTHDIDGTAVDMTPKVPAQQSEEQPAPTPGGKAKAA